MSKVFTRLPVSVGIYQKLIVVLILLVPWPCPAGSLALSTQFCVQL